MSEFRFKKFVVDQRNCAMKINTDGVLLGAMAKGENSKQILDVGTGTGVIALMLAQRYEQATISAIEIDTAAADMAKKNVLHSGFNERIKIVQHDFRKYTTEIQFDLIVSNPPFYIDSLHNPDHRKMLARHAEMSFFDYMLYFSRQFLTDEGAVEMILPTSLADEQIRNASLNHLHLERQIHISSFENTDIIRKIIRLTKKEVQDPVNERFVIYKEKGIYSDEYKNVLSPFFLAF